MSTEITEVNQTVVISDSDTGVVEVVTQGPAGASASAFGVGELADVDDSARVDKSVLYYDQSAGKWKGDDVNTILTITDGGNF